uniref:Uncharacterized protein n=1 Tax=Shewanella putrefaciens (strain 200) TaxID=399804 RepID=E6XH04_SHEP2
MKKEDWQIVLIANSFVEEVDCNSGCCRCRVFTGERTLYKI